MWRLPNRTLCVVQRAHAELSEVNGAKEGAALFVHNQLAHVLLHANLWRGHFTDLPGFADVQSDCNNENCMSICPSSHPIAPLKKSVHRQHTVSHGRAISTWSFGTDQENHVVCLRRCCEAPLARARVKNQNTIPQTFQAFASKQVRNRSFSTQHCS